MHQALYRKWRPQIFDDVYGQEHITSILKYETEKSRFSHAYLFCGSRGTGKTTCAKILAKAVNCEAPVNGNPCNECPSCRAIDAGTVTDILEMDAASNNSVDNIREIRDEVIYTPSVLKCKVYIVDEVHMLSSSAFNALLKTLEEPPSHVVFILATTELHKLPATIISRCQRFDFRRINVSDIMARLSHIAQKEGIKAENDALRLIAKNAQGGMRDAISLFELCAGSNDTLTAAAVADIIGISGNQTVAKVLTAIHTQDYDTIFSVIDDIVSSSKDISVFWNDVIAFCRDMLIYKTTKRPEEYLDITESEKKLLSDTTSLFTKDTLIYFMRLLNDSLYTMQRAGGAKRNIAEMTLIKMGDEGLSFSEDALLSRISKLEAQLAGANVTYNAPKIIEEPVETADKAPKNPDKPQKAETQPVAVSKDQTPQKEEILPVTEEKIIRGWHDICNKTCADNPSVNSLMKQARGYSKNDGSVVIKFPTAFPMNMVKQSSVPATLPSILSGVLKREITESQIEYTVSQIIEDADDFDDLTENN